MSSTKYLEFDSSYRNRNQDPYPASFTIGPAQSGQLNSTYAVDPVCNSSPVLQWNNSFQEVVAANTTATNLTIDTTFSPSDNTILKITTANTIRQVDNFYVGCVLTITIGGTSVSRRIIAYKFLNNTTGIFTLESAIPDGTPSADGVIQNPTPISTATASSVIKFFIPTGSYIDNFYNGMYVQSLGTTVVAESRQIIAYDGTLRLATLASATTDDWSSNGNANENFVIRKDLQVQTANLITWNTAQNIVQLNSSLSPAPSFYNGSALRWVVPVPTTAGFSTLVAPYSQESRIINYIGGDGTFTSISAGTATFTLAFDTSSPIDNFYNNCYITNSTTGETRQILTYTGLTHSGTVSANWGAGASGNIWYIRTAFIEPPTGTFPGTTTYELELFTRDNYNPFFYTGSIISSDQASSYEIELLNLVLPNILLSSGRGGRVAFYPYVYVELEQVSSASKGIRNIIYSNNPNSSKMLFRAIVDDTPQPLISPFVKIDSDGMVNTIKFKPTDIFKFSVYHADGTLFQTVQSDYYSPTQPNPMVQVSACFAFKKIG